MSGSGRQGGGLQAQRRTITAVCRRLVTAVEETGSSAEDLERPGIEAALRQLESADGNGLVAANTGRLSRQLGDLNTLITTAHTHGWALQALDCNLDTTTTEAAEPEATLLACFARGAGARLSRSFVSSIAKGWVFDPIGAEVLPRHDATVSKQRSFGISRYSVVSLWLAVLVAVIASAALTGTGAMAASASARPAVAPVLGYHLQATLAPVGTTHGSGEFTALLMRTGPPLLKAPGVAQPLPAAQLPAGCRLLSAPAGSTIPDRIKCGTEPAFPIPNAGLHWVLVWRLTFTGLVGSTSATIETIEGSAGAYAIMARLCNHCSGAAVGHLTLTPAQASTLIRGGAYAAVSGVSAKLRGRIVNVPPSTPTQISFGRTGGSIRPFTVTVMNDGRIRVSGPGWSGRTGTTVSLPVRQGLLKLAQAEGFFSMPTMRQCPSVLPDIAARFVTISTVSTTRSVTVRGSCSRPFEELYAVLNAAVLGASLAG